jgi:predicted nucleic acid-binding protein
VTRLVDTSVIVKWAVEEEGSEAAFALYGTDLAAPELLMAELANALLKKVRARQIGPEQAAASYAEILAHLDFLPTTGLETRAFEIALQLDHPVYDCYFLALAEALATSIITADLQLIKRCGGTPFAALVETLDLNAPPPPDRP